MANSHLSTIKVIVTAVHYETISMEVIVKSELSDFHWDMATLNMRDLDEIVMTPELRSHYCKKSSK